MKHAEYLSHREQIEAALAFVCRRERLSPANADDFCSIFRLRLMQDDYAILRAFQGRSSFRTYLLSVIAHAYQDWRNARWGKWRNSTEARRLGPLAVLLERLVVRDGLTLDEAYETLRINHRTRESRDSIERLAALLPPRSPRRFVSADVLADVGAAHHHPGEAIRQADAAAAASRISDTLAAALDRFNAQDRVILRMRFEEDFTVARIARVLQLDQKPLYRRLERLIAALRGALEARGLTPDVAREVLDARGFDVRDEGRENAGAVRPFQEGPRVATARKE